MLISMHPLHNREDKSHNLQQIFIIKKSITSPLQWSTLPLRSMVGNAEETNLQLIRSTHSGQIK